MFPSKSPGGSELDWFHQVPATMYVDKKLKGVREVQTLSRLNRVCPGKDNTFILDFKNDLEDIKKSFSEFYEYTELAETLDPNLVYDLERKIESFNIINMDDVDEFIKLAYKDNSKKTSKNTQRQISYVSRSHERVKTYNRDEIIEIRATLRTFSDFCSLMIQIAEFKDVELHKLYIFSKFLVKVVDVAGEDEIDISVSVGGMEEEKDTLFRIIKEINDLFNVNFGETEVLAAMQIDELLKKDDDLKRRAQNNTIDNFKFPFKDAYQNSVIAGLDKNQEFYETLLT